LVQDVSIRSTRRNTPVVRIQESSIQIFTDK
jgi:hypothetical protein